MLHTPLSVSHLTVMSNHLVRSSGATLFQKPSGQAHPGRLEVVQRMQPHLPGPFCQVAAPLGLPLTRVLLGSSLVGLCSLYPSLYHASWADGVDLLAKTWYAHTRIN